MKALIATPDYLLLCDLARRTVQVLASGEPEYYGISWTRDGRDLITGHSGIRNDTLVDLASYANSERGRVRIAGRALDAVDLSQPHQLVAGPAGTVLVTNTGRNCLSVVDPAGQFVREVRLSPSRWDRISMAEKPGSHINSVWANHHAAYVLAHNFDRKSFVAKVSLEDYQVLETIPAEEVIGAHNVWPMPDGGLLVCASPRGELVELRSGTTLWSSGTASHTRGLAVTAEHIVVGESAHAARGDRRSSLSGLWVLDRHSFRTLDYFCLGPYGQVHEIRVLDVPDEAHHGIPLADPDTLARDDVLASRRSHRLEAAQQALDDRAHRERLNVVFGHLMSDEREGLRAGNLTAALFRRTWPDAWSVRYDFGEPRGEQHLGLLLRYEGDGDDVNATVAILTPAGPGEAGGGSLGFWEHDGQGWKGVSGERRPVPRFGRVVVDRGAEGAWVEVSGDEQSAWRHPLPRMPVGLRLINCSVVIG